MHESEAMAVLVAARGVGYARRAAALAGAGSALAVLADPAACRAQLGEGGVEAVRASLREAPRMLEALWREGVHLIVRGSEGYPALLERTARPPHLLYVLGEASLCDRFPLAIVGTRAASGYGLRHTRAIAGELAEQGMCVVSGLALGVDAAAHEGALSAGGRTVAVLGSALNRMYPRENAGLMERIIACGGSVATEYAPGTEPTRYSFLQRNRIIAGLALGVLVTEGAHRSGALSTAHHALDEGREVFALPGDVDRVTAQLPNRLIADGAHPVTCAADILNTLVIEPGCAESADARRGSAHPQRREEQRMQPAAPPPEEGTPERAVYDALVTEELDFDALCARTGLSGEALGTALAMMELDGAVVSLPGLRYRLT